jgi:hypothetical protein
MKADRVAERIDGGMNLGAQPALAGADGCEQPFFLRAPARCWWARTMVESIMAYSLSASLARCSKISFKTPRAAQRLNRVCTTRKSPNRSGRSRHGIPGDSGTAPPPQINGCSSQDDPPLRLGQAKDPSSEPTDHLAIRNALHSSH